MDIINKEIIFVTNKIDNKIKLEVDSLLKNDFKVTLLVRGKKLLGKTHKNQPFTIKRINAIIPSFIKLYDTVIELKKTTSARADISKTSKTIRGFFLQVLFVFAKILKEKNLFLINSAYFYNRLMSEIRNINVNLIHSHELRYVVLLNIFSRFYGKKVVIDYSQPVLSIKKQSNDLYEQAGIWIKEVDETTDKRREAILKLLPGDVGKIIDIGCGNGYITNNLYDENYHIDACDLSEEALKHVKTNKYVASIDNLPFEDRSYNLALCTEVIEHLSGEMYAQALNELQRISSKYILISVPFRENLNVSRSKCYICGCKFHINNHYHSFDLKKLKNLFEPEFEQIDSVYSGNKYYYHPFLLMLKRYFGGYWARNAYTVCPACGHDQHLIGTKEMNPVNVWCDSKNHNIKEEYRAKYPSHVSVLYRCR